MEILQRWKSLTWDDLALWAGDQSVARGRAYQRDGQVEDLTISKDGRLLATVVGGDYYSVSVRLLPNKTKGAAIESVCTCPVGDDGCKHAVATVAAYRDFLARNRPVPTGSPKDPRWKELEDVEEGLDEDDEDALDEDDYDEDEDEQDEEDEKPAARVRARRDPRKGWGAKIRAHIDAKSREELANLVWSLTERFPDLHQEFRERIALGEGDADRLLKQARQELRSVTAEPGWNNHWRGESSIPNYSGLNRRLERLIELGHADAVVELGEEIIESGMEQVGQSDDEGETASAFAECLGIVFKAVAKSSLSPARKLLFIIDAELEDEYNVMEEADVESMNEDFEPAVWSEVADELVRRVAAHSKRRGDDDFSRTYRRDQISGWLVKALEKAGREDEALAIYEREARITDSYERLVGFLMSKKRYEEVERWAREGIEKTAQKSSGIASVLIGNLAELARRRRQWDVVAAHIAWEFFERPSADGFRKLTEAAARAGCEEKVRELALRFLETGVSPAQKPNPSQDQLVPGGAGGEWPLPLPDYFSAMLTPGNRHHRAERPHYDVLIHMAIAAGRPDEVLEWYDRMCAERKSERAFYGFDGYSDLVARAVEESHPQRALDIYHLHVKDNLPNAHQSAYEIVVSYLRRMRPLMKSLDREEEWRQMLAEIRIRYRNRPKFMEMLQRLDGRTILETQKRKKQNLGSA